MTFFFIAGRTALLTLFSIHLDRPSHRCPPPGHQRPSNQIPPTPISPGQKEKRQPSLRARRTNGKSRRDKRRVLEEPQRVVRRTHGRSVPRVVILATEGSRFGIRGKKRAGERERERWGFLGGRWLRWWSWCGWR